MRPSYWYPKPVKRLRWQLRQMFFVVALVGFALMAVGGLIAPSSNKPSSSKQSVVQAQAQSANLVGQASIVDGDTIDIHGQRIRFLDIDTPESRQPCWKADGSTWRCGQKAAFALADWIGARTVSCATTKLDRYGRHLASCTVGGQDIAVWLAENGLGVPYRDCQCTAVRQAASRARASKIGIWSGTFDLPWDWRKANH